MKEDLQISKEDLISLAPKTQNFENNQLGLPVRNLILHTKINCKTGVIIR